MATFGNSLLAGLSGLSSPASWQTPAPPPAPAPAPPPSDMSLAHSAPVGAGPSLGLQSPEAFATTSPVINPKAWAASDIAPTPSPSIDATFRQRPIDPMVSLPMPNYSSASQPLTPEQAAAAAASVASPATARTAAPMPMPRMGGGGGGSAPNPLTDPYSDKFDMMSGRLLTAPAREGVRLGQELWEQQGATKEMVAQSQAEGLQVAAQQQKNAIDQQAAAERARQSEREVYKQAYDSRIAELDAARKDIAASGPSVGKFWDDAGFLGSVAAIVATGLGEYAAIKTGQPNRAGEMLDKAIDRSLKMQMAQLENKKDAAAMQNTILGQMRQKFGDEEAAYGAAKVMMHDLAAQKLNEIATRYQGRDAAFVANALGKEQELQGKLATNVIAQGAADREVAKQKAAAAAAASESMRQRKLIEEQNKEIFKTGLSVAEADAKKNGGQATVLRAPMQIGDQVLQAGTPIVMGADGVPRIPKGGDGETVKTSFISGFGEDNKPIYESAMVPKDAAKDLRKATVTYGTMVTVLRELRTIATTSGTSLSPAQKERAGVLVTELKFAVKDAKELGQITPGDEGMINTYIDNDPTGMKLAGTTKLDTLLDQTAKNYQIITDVATGRGVSNPRYGAPK